jgi:hypothetical protein
MPPFLRFNPPAVAYLLVAFLFVVATLMLGMVALSAPSAAANATADSTPDPTPTPTQAPNETGALIQPGLELVAHDVDDETASLTFRSSGPVAVTIADAGGFYKGGELERRTTILRKGTHTIEFPITVMPDGRAGVTVSTSDTLYAVPLEGSNYWFQGSPTWDLMELAGLGAVVGTLIATAVVAYLRVRGGRKEVDRLS